MSLLKTWILIQNLLYLIKTKIEIKKLEMVFQKIKHFFVLNYFTLFYYKEIVDRYRIHYDRNKFRRLYDYLENYPLFHFRDVFPAEYALRRGAGVDFPVEVQRPIHLNIIRFFFFFYVVRSFVVAYIPATVNTLQKRVLAGVELYRNDYFYLETTFLFWSSISFLFLHFLPTRVLDYKFLAIFSMSENNLDFLPPSAFGLLHRDFLKFKKFRSLTFTFYNLTTVTLSLFGPFCASYLYTVGSLYSSHPVSSIFWTLVLDTWIYIVCTVIYSNLSAFIVVAMYIHIKQKSIGRQITGVLSQINLSRKNLQFQTFSCTQLLFSLTRYSHLYDELADYNHFWALFLSSVFIFYILLISFVIYIALFSSIIFYVKSIYWLVFAVHVILLAALIFLVGGLVRANGRLTSNVTFSWTKYEQRFQVERNKLKSLRPGPMVSLKMANVTEVLISLNGRGFRLLNGYQITDDTARQIIVNVAAYFLLVLKYK